MMKKTTRSKGDAGESAEAGGIDAYSQAQPPELRGICERLREMIEGEIPKAASKVWHGSPVWFLDENPVVGYEATPKGVKLLFWNGKAFGEEALAPVGKYGAAQTVFPADGDIDAKAVRRWLKKARTDVFDSKAFFKKLRESR